MFSGLGSREFLARWSQDLIASHRQEVVAALAPRRLESDWIGLPPATDEQIAATELRLGVRLPPSNVAFLQVSNGWPVTGNFNVAGLRMVP